MDGTASGTGDSGGNPDESDKERLDRNLHELLEGLRVALPGVQVLFAFLLTIPFSMGFESVTSFQRDVYFATLISTTLASICLIGPSARHRARFREGDKKWIVRTGNNLAQAGLIFLSLAIFGAILLISDVLFSLEAAILTVAVIAIVLGWVWFAAPWIREARELNEDPG
jgi:hypothetical protein